MVEPDTGGAANLSPRRRLLERVGVVLLTLASAFMMTTALRKGVEALGSAEPPGIGRWPAVAFFAVCAVGLFEGNRRVLPRWTSWLFAFLGLVTMLESLMVAGLLLLEAAVIGWLGPRRKRGSE